MNDITALMQRIPERKRHDWSQSVMRDCDFCNQWALTVKHEDGARICASCCDAEYTSKLEVENSALIEALEKAQHTIAEQDQQLISYAEISTRNAERVADLESRTVTVRLPKLYNMLYRDEFNKPYVTKGVYSAPELINTLRAAGIEVIEGEA